MYVALCDAEHITDELQNVRVVSMRIHPDLPEFTFTRIIGGYFDGYLDMRLMRWQDGAGGLLAHEYFWLWDVGKKLFVLNE